MTLAPSACALVGTWIQMVDQLSRLSRTDPEGYAAFRIIESWKDEHQKLRNPIMWMRRQRLVRDLLRGSPQEAEDHRRSQRAVLSWALLVMASFLTVCASAWSLIAPLFITTA